MGRSCTKGGRRKWGKEKRKMRTNAILEGVWKMARSSIPSILYHPQSSVIPSPLAGSLGFKPSSGLSATEQVQG